MFVELWFKYLNNSFQLWYVNEALDNFISQIININYILDELDKTDEFNLTVK